MEKGDSLEKARKFLEEPFLSPVKLPLNPQITVIIPTFNNMEGIRKTLLSLLNQKDCLLEILIIDAYSTDQTVEIVKSFLNKEGIHQLNILFYPKYDRFAILNEGAKQAKGEYLIFLYPGDSLLFHSAVRYLLSHLLTQGKQDLIVTASEIRDGRGEPKLFFRSLTKKKLSEGKQPTTLQGCLFRKRCFLKMGGFDASYRQRGGLEWFCRFLEKGELKVLFLNRVLTDYDLKSVTRSMIFTHFMETGKIVFKYFGFIAWIKWLFIQKDSRRICLSLYHSLKTAFTG